MGTRERLLEAAIRLLARDGYARITTRTLVAEANAHLPAVNYFFGSKDSLLSEAVAEALRRWGATTMAALDTTGSPRQRLEQALHRYLSTLHEDRSYVVAAAEAFAQVERNDQIRARLAESYSEFRDLVARHGTGTGADSFDADRSRPASKDSLILAGTLIALFDGLAIQWLVDPDHSLSADEVLAGLDLMAALREQR